MRQPFLQFGTITSQIRNYWQIFISFFSSCSIFSGSYSIVNREVNPRMKRNESVKSVTRFRSDHQRPALALSFRQNSLTIGSLAQHSAYLAQKAYKEEEAGDPNSQAPAVSWCKLFRFAKPWEFVLLFAGVIFATLSGLFVPVGVIVYGEFTSLLIDRTVMNGTSTPTLTIAWFGGGRILTNASPEENRQALIEDSQAFGIGCTIFSVLQFIVSAISVDLFNYAALRQIDRVKKRFLEAVLRQDITWYDLNTSMNFATKVSDDVEKYREGIGEKVPMFIYLVMSFVTAVIISFAYGWELTLVILSCAPIIIATTAIVAKVQSSLTTQELKAYSIAGVVAEEVLSSIRTVVAFGGEEKEIQRYQKRLDPAKKMGIRKGVYSGIGSGVMWLIIYATYALAFWYGVGLILDSRHEEEPVYTPAVLMIVFFSVLQGAQNVGLTAPHLEAMASARASAGAIFAVIDRKPAIDSLSEEGSKPTLDGNMELRNVYFRYPARPDVQVLNGLSLEIRRNETIALVGASGSGKSTVLQLLQRMYDPDVGSVIASGNDLRDINVHHFRNHVAVVGQEPVLFAGTIKENIRMSNPQCTDEEIIMASKQAYCHSFIKHLPNGYDTLIGERGAQLSGGQKQRIAIARALVRKPKILILDEATSALDSQSEAKVQRALDAAAAGRTTIMVSHRLATVLNANRIVFIEKGEVVEDGTHEELMVLRGRYYQLVLENEPSIAPDASTPESSKKHARIRRPKLEKLVSLDSMTSVDIDEDSGSEDEVEPDQKEVKEYEPTTWEIMKLCEPEKYLMTIGIIAAIAVGSSFPCFAILFGETYGLLESKDEDYVRGGTNWIAVLFLLVGVYTGFGIFFQIYIFNLTGVRLTARLRVAAFKTMLAQEMGWFDHPLNGIGALCARLAADAAAVQGATGTRIGALMQAAATISIGILVSMYFTWRMTLVSLVSVPMVIIAVVLEGRILAEGIATIREASNKATTIATEAITNIRTVSAFCGEKSILARYNTAGINARLAARKSLRWRGCVFAFGQTAPVAGYALSLWYGGILVANREVPYKDVIKVSEALIFGAWMMGQALAFAPNFGAAVLAAGRVMTLLERKPLVESTHAPSVSENYVADGKIQYKNIKFRYPTRREVQVLRGLSLAIPKGKRVALVGPSGCGKSTLIQLLQRLYDPDDGNVYLDDHSIVGDMRLSTLRRNLGIVSQEPVLFDRTIAENIAYGDNTRDVPIEEIVKAAKAANVHTFIAALPEAYNTRIGARASQLSGGQKQRIAIARALVRNPRVLLLDEATSALDTHSERVVQEALDRASEGRTCLIIAHRLATIKNADVICVIDQGVVAEMGTHNELIALRKIYAKLYELQCGFVEESEENLADEQET
ncbi:multidrug resistance protein homolog 49-like isoform X2 [Pararge aegeria]|uniref:multidrug resistance protein homolog 49-like isoform X2 n=1 Tax=Pararge aegeria TaxID=116150 RepID=UPI0019D09FFF|nr:multidrug resistance protein homolog 49-like isoform X2 [Pararge aegeria]